MKPIYLEFCGINSFSERAEVDFEALLDYGIFGIFGDTGSGKSTVLDAIGFALYGGVARSRSGSVSDIINYKADKAYVIFEFRIVYEGRRRAFRVERELKRKNAVQSVRVYERGGEKLLALSEGVRESNALLERIIGLEQRDFEKCIALPQGEFAQFVKAQRSDRLKLVSRLFDLEEYGERLIKKANARNAALAGEKNVLEARLEPYAEITEAGNAALKEQTESLAVRERILREESERARAEEKRISSLVEKQEAYFRVASRLKVMDGEREEILALEKKISGLEYANAVVKSDKEAAATQKSYADSEKVLNAAKREWEGAEKRFSECSAWDTEKTDAEIVRLSGIKARAEADALTEKTLAESERKLGEVRREYAAEKNKFQDFFYEKERDALNARLAELGEENFIAYAETHGKAELLRAEYAVFAKELQELTRRHPVIAPDAVPLTEKYSRFSLGEKTDFSRIKQQFETRERARSELNAEMLALEKKNGLYRAHTEKLAQLAAEGNRLRGECEELKVRLGEDRIPLQEAERLLAEKQKEKALRADSLRRATQVRSYAATALAAAEEKFNAAKSNLEQAEKRLFEALSSGGFECVGQAEELLSAFGQPQAAKLRIEKFKEEYAAVTARKKELEAEELTEGTQEKLTDCRSILEACVRKTDECTRELALKRDEARRGEEALEKKRALEKEYNRVKKQAETSERLKKLLEGNKFMEFVAEEYLQNVALNASNRLLSLTDGRYFLRYDKGFFVGDNFNGGALRGVYTLSGGETFLVSLSLALALSAEICARSMRPVEFFFLDEGFGTLDERLVDTVMDSLEKLKNEHFAIGIISHVEELKHRIARKLSVEKATEKRGSRITAE